MIKMTQQEFLKEVNRLYENALDFMTKNKLPKNIESHYEGMAEAYLNIIDYLETYKIKENK